MRLTGIVQLEDDHYVALCPELDVVSQGDSLEEATANLKEACELFLEHACDEEIQSRLRPPVHLTEFEAGGKPRGRRPRDPAATGGGAQEGGDARGSGAGRIDGEAAGGAA